MDRSTRSLARVGTTIRGKYRLDALLGVGGMAAVYAATHRNGRRAALKLLHPELALNAGIRTRFLREGYAANLVGHAGVVPVLDDDDDEQGLPFLVMELLEGETLGARWERAADRRLPLAEVLRHADQVLDVLAAAHPRGVVHRDIKPDNLFLTHSRELKVMDFGIARLLDGTGATRSGDVLGTPAFISPEQAGGWTHEVEPRSDLWSVGAVTFSLLSGRYVHAARTAQEHMVYAATQQACSLATVVPGLPGEVVTIVDTALAFDKERRWPSARSMQNMVRAVAVAS